MWGERRAHSLRQRGKACQQSRRFEGPSPDSHRKGEQPSSPRSKADRTFWLVQWGNWLPLTSLENRLLEASKVAKDAMVLNMSRGPGIGDQLWDQKDTSSIPVQLLYTAVASLDYIRKLP